MHFPKAKIEALWAPWRVEYFERKDGSRDFLSDAAETTDDASHLVVARRATAFLIMNRYPYAVGHLMAVPRRKAADLADLTAEELADLFSLAVHAQKILRAVIRAEGFNIGMNLGECAGAGVPDHLHLHIVPRWSGDTNFMPVLSGTRVLSESLQGLYEKLIATENL